MKFSYHRIHLYLVICHITAVSIFLLGFLPVHNKSSARANRDINLPKEFDGLPLSVDEWYTSKIDRLVFVVIDALRADFILNKQLEYMPYLTQLHRDNQACSYLARAHTPTVTLPRIKALVTGTVPGFTDVIYNLGGNEIEEDSIIHQLEAHGHKMVFYGDDTWLKLFPGKFLPRSDGTTSFFVNDYTEVDYNVTRHLDFELIQTDWSVMILHYLGLDHIGHVSGPKSYLVPGKLREMDDVIRQLHQLVNANKTGILICGDHGMSDSGSHGGSSQAEVEVPLIFVMNDCRPDDTVNLQIDLPPTLSVLMGIPIPNNNLGSLLPGILAAFRPEERLYALYINARTVAKQYEQNVGAENSNSDYQRALKLYGNWLTGSGTATEPEIARLFQRSTADMSSHLINSLVHFDLYSMIIAVILAWQVLVVVLPECGILNSRPSTHRGFSVQLFGVVLFVSVFVHIGICLSIDNESRLCLNEQSSLGTVFVLCIFVFSLITINGILIQKRCLFTFKKLGNNVPELFLVIVSLLHAVSLASSSFVEEEHQTYYFFVNTLALLLFYNGPKETATFTRLVGSMGILRIARSWNQTGDKWINEPDIEEWLNHPDHRLYLTVASLLGVVCLFQWVRSTQRLGRLELSVTAIALFGILAHRAALGVFSIPYPSSMGITEAVMTYSSLIVMAGLWSCCNKGSPSSALITIWLVLTSLLKRPHNLLLTWMQLVQYSLLQPVLAAQLRPFHYGLAHYSLGMAWYFQQGNGNNLARIELQSGYVGLPSYNPAVVGFLLSCATYSGPVMALLLSFAVRKDTSLLYGILFPRALVVAIFLVIVTVMRHHLFIWTVFSPKLLYECASSLVLLLILVIKTAKC